MLKYKKDCMSLLKKIFYRGIVTVDYIFLWIYQGGISMTSKNKSVDMCNGPLTKKIIFFTIPIIISGFLQLFFNAADMVVVGRFSGDISLAAVGSTASLTNLMVNLFMGFSVSAGITITHAIGAKQSRDIHEIVHTAVPTSLISGLIVGIIGVSFAPTFLKLMGTPSEVLPKASLYLRIIFAGMPANMIYNFGASMLRATGETKKPLYYLIFSGSLNVILNLIFVIFLHMDVAGVALATIISQILSAFLIIRNLMRGNEYFKLNLKQLRIHKQKLMRIISIGLPAGIQGSLFSISNVLIQSSINTFGSSAIAGNSAAASIENFVYIVMNAFYQSTITFAGQNMGAKKYGRITKVMLTCLSIVLICGGISGEVVYRFGRPLLSIYCPGNPDAITVGLEKLSIVCRFYFICGIMEVMTGVLRGMGYSMISMFVSLFGACFLRVAWIYTIFAKFHTLKCLFISYPVSWMIVFVIDVIIYCFLYKNLQKKQRNIS